MCKKKALYDDYAIKVSILLQYLGQSYGIVPVYPGSVGHRAGEADGLGLLASRLPMSVASNTVWARVRTTAHGAQPLQAEVGVEVADQPGPLDGRGTTGPVTAH